MTAAFTFQDLIDDTYLASIERQRRLSDIAGEGTSYDGSFEVDLQEGVLRFVGQETLTVRAHLLGSAAPGPGTWLWAWHNIAGYPDHVIAIAEHIRGQGERLGLAELTTAEVPLQGTPREHAGRFAAVCSAVGGGLPLYTFDAGRGTVAAVLLEHPIFADPPGSAQASIHAITAGLGYAPETVADWRRAVDGYARQRGLEVRVADDGGRTIVGPDGHADLTFDELGRLTNLTGHFGSSDAS